MNFDKSHLSVSRLCFSVITFVVCQKAFSTTAFPPYLYVLEKAPDFAIVLDRFVASLFFNFILPCSPSTVTRTDRAYGQTSAVFPSKQAGNGVAREIRGGISIAQKHDVIIA